MNHLSIGQLHDLSGELAEIHDRLERIQSAVRKPGTWGVVLDGDLDEAARKCVRVMTDLDQELLNRTKPTTPTKATLLANQEATHVQSD